MSTKIQRRSAAATPSPTPFSLPVAMTTFLPEEIIVAKILPRLHVKALFRFKCVSKGYESIISDPNWGRKYVESAYSSPQASSSSGLLALFLYPFVQQSYSIDDFSENVKDLTQSVNSSSQYYPPGGEEEGHEPSIYASIVSLSFDINRMKCEHQILVSSGGLILTRLCWEDDEAEEGEGFNRFALCVSNPLTRQCVKIPYPTMPKYDKYHFSSVGLLFGFATRWDQAKSLLTYKVVIIYDKDRSIDYRKTTVQIFSSDSGSWVTREVGPCYSPIIFHIATNKTGFCYKGVLHWFACYGDGTIITYDPYDNPDQFRFISLPKNPTPGRKRDNYKSLIYSGEQEILKYCEIQRNTESGVDRLLVRHYDDAKGEWCLEGEYTVPSLPHFYRWLRSLMFAPYPWNDKVLCHPFTDYNKFAVINLRTGKIKWQSIYKGGDDDYPCLYLKKFLTIRLCPWSSPYYAKSC